MRYCIKSASLILYKDNDTCIPFFSLVISFMIGLQEVVMRMHADGSQANAALPFYPNVSFRLDERPDLSCLGDNQSSNEVLLLIVYTPKG